MSEKAEVRVFKPGDMGCWHRWFFVSTDHRVIRCTHCTRTLASTEPFVRNKWKFWVRWL